MEDLQEFLGMKKYYLNMIKEKDQRIAELEQKLAELKQTYNKANEKLKNITEELENNFVDGQELNDLREEKDKLIYELEKELDEIKEKAIVLPKNLQVGNKVFWANEDGLFIGEIKTISQDTAVWFYVVYDNGLTYWHLLKDFNNEVFATKQEAQAKLKEIQGNE